MIITRGITHKINMAPGSYEGVELHASVTVDSDKEYPDRSPSEVAAIVQEVLDLAMQEDVVEAARCVDPEGDSYIVSWRDGR